VLQRPVSEINTRAPAVEQLDEVVCVRRVRVATPGEKLADHHVGRGAARRGRDEQQCGKSEQGEVAESRHRRLPSGRGTHAVLLTELRSPPESVRSLFGADLSQIGRTITSE